MSSLHRIFFINISIVSLIRIKKANIFNILQKTVLIGLSTCVNVYSMKKESVPGVVVIMQLF